MQTTRKLQFLSGAVFLLLLTIVSAQENKPEGETSPPANIAEPPPLPPKVRNQEEAPVVSIHTEEGKIIEEYRQAGRLYMVKVTPVEGLAYYYMDLDGDGDLELQPYDNGMNPVAPHMWRLKQW